METSETTVDAPVNPLIELDKPEIIFCIGVARGDSGTQAVIDAGGFSQVRRSAGIQSVRMKKRGKIQNGIAYIKANNIKAENELLVNDFGMSAEDIKNVRNILTQEANKTINVNNPFEDVREAEAVPENNVCIPKLTIKTAPDVVGTLIKANDEIVKGKLITITQAALFLDHIAMVSGANFEIDLGGGRIGPKPWSDLTPIERFCIERTLYNDDGKVTGYRLRNMDKALEHWVKSKGLLRESSDPMDERPAFVGINISFGDKPILKEGFNHSKEALTLPEDNQAHTPEPSQPIALGPDRSNLPPVPGHSEFKF